ncbi:MAG: small multi-drug export protein [Clostridia bacterium]
MDAFINQMVTTLQEFFAGNAYLTVFVVSLLPMIEVTGSIPIAIELGIHPVTAYFFTSISSVLICPVIILCLKPVLNAFKKTKFFKKIALILEENFKSRAADLEKKAEERGAEQKLFEKKASQKASDQQVSYENESGEEGEHQPLGEAQDIGQGIVLSEKKRIFYKSLGLFLFVVLPFPMTGLWTGSAIAAFIDLKFRYSLPSIILGNFVGAIVILGATLLLGERSYIMLLALGLFIVFAIASAFVTVLLKNRKAKKLSDVSASSKDADKVTQDEDKID